MVRKAGFVIVAIVAGLAAWMLHDSFYGPPLEVTGQGTVTAKSRFSDKSVTRPTRQVRRGALAYSEVQTPGGAWIDCAGDCAETYRRQVLDLWETQQEEAGRGGR